MNSCFKCKIKLTFPVESQPVSLAGADTAAGAAAPRFSILLPILSFSRHRYTSGAGTPSSLGQLSAPVFYFSYHSCGQICNAGFVYTMFLPTLL